MEAPAAPQPVAAVEAVPMLPAFIAYLILRRPILPVLQFLRAPVVTVRAAVPRASAQYYLPMAAPTAQPAAKAVAAAVPAALVMVEAVATLTAPAPAVMLVGEAEPVAAAPLSILAVMVNMAAVVADKARVTPQDLPAAAPCTEPVAVVVVVLSPPEAPLMLAEPAVVVLERALAAAAQPVHPAAAPAG